MTILLSATFVTAQPVARDLQKGVAIPEVRTCRFTEPRLRKRTRHLKNQKVFGAFRFRCIDHIDLMVLKLIQTEVGHNVQNFETLTPLLFHEIKARSYIIYARWHWYHKAVRKS